MIFPPNCVESTNPVLMRRKRCTKMDVQPVEGWKLVMALKSGLLMESTWALDVLNVLSFDDNAFLYFGLGNMPGLMEVLLEHWRATLISMFGITDDLEVDEATEGERKLRRKVNQQVNTKHALISDRKRRASGEVKEEAEEDVGCEIALGMVPSDLEPEEKAKVLGSSCQNYTKRPRFSDEDVEVVQRDDTLFVVDDERQWDKMKGGFELTSDHWRQGGGNSTTHIIPPFAGELGIVPFVRLLKDLAPSDNESSAKTSTIEVKKEKLEEEDTNSQEVNGIDHEAKASEAEAEPVEDIIDKIKRLTGVVFRDPDEARARWSQKDLEDECYARDEPSLCLVTDFQDSVGRRAMCISTILRNLSFVPGNEFEFSRNVMFLKIAGQLLLLHHWHPARVQRQPKQDKSAVAVEASTVGDVAEEEEEDVVKEETTVTEQVDEDSEWWWEYLHVIRENVMVIFANIAGALELKHFDGDVILPIMDGLLEWAVSPSAYAQDPFPYLGPHSPVSPQRLAIETICKLCLHEHNVDFLLSTPPYSRIEKLTR